ncbi:UPF0182 family protein [Clostridium lundense]|uniref:UPF0182 family protein n=1 Tax=Clostridium lundense TaxID=319475 RepID=UPI0004895AC2|nr:UPF0182 family protein [Clostridium lundense]
MKKGITTISFILIVLLIVVFFNRISSFIINIEWFKEVSYLSVYFTKLIAVAKLLIPSFIIVFLCIWTYYSTLKKSIFKLKKELELDTKKRKREDKIFFLVDFIVSFITAYIFSNEYWYNIIQFTNSIDFKVKDPIFNNDVSFYIFKLPLIESTYTAIMSLLIFLVLVTLVIYFLLDIKDKVQYGNSKNIFSNVQEIKSGITTFAGRQLAIISALILLFLSLGFLIKSWNLVYSPRGVAYGASYTDIHVTLIFYKIIIVVSLIASIVVFLSVLRKRIKPIVISISIILILILSEGLVSNLVQTFLVKSNEKKLEENYIKYNIDYTRKAFNIDNIQEIQLDVKNDLTNEDIKANKDIIDNIRINAFEPALEFYNQYQTIRPYYIFNDMDIDRYKIKDKYVQVFISPRELNLQNIDPDTWQNRHLIYTHGYGVAMSKVNSVTSDGQPDFLIKDIPPENNTNISLKNPRIYFGEKTNDYAIVNTKLKEFDYPKGGDNKINEYDGKSGIRMTFFNKLLFAISERNFNFIFSRDITRDSRILLNRNIIDRVNKIAPFLVYDKDPYITIYNDRLYWIIDAYTTSNRYPYSQPYNNINYIRNSVKVVVDALDGDVSFYIVDKNDPIVMSYSKIFKNLFKDFNTLPEGIRQHFKYPEDIFKIQCNVLEKYHMTDPMAFLNGDDLWEISKNQKLVETEKSVSESPCVIMKLKGEKSEEMVLLEYFNMKDRNTMSSILGARMDRGNYGKFVMYSLPSHKTIYSPYFFKQKLKQDPLISKELSLWDAGGSHVQFGDTIIVPVNNSLLYIESMYLRANGKNSAPEVKRVILSYGDKVVLAENINSALNQLFNINGNNVKEKSESNSVDKGKIQGIKEAKEIYNKAIQAQKDGDWTKYGEYIGRLGKMLENMAK